MDSPNLPTHCAADTLVDLVRAELTQPVQPAVARMAAAVAAQHGDAARAVLFYGSCLREQQLDGLMLDFYLIVSDYRAAYAARWLATANRLIPPNVFPFVHDGLTAKYAVLSEADFARLCGPETRNVSVWARFAQPSRLVWSADARAAAGALAAVARAAPTLIGAAMPQCPAHGADPLAVWRTAFTLTYSAELRAERGGRPDALVDADPARYALFTAPVMAHAHAEVATLAASRRRWAVRRWTGKGLTVLRLAKASLTFAGGIDYLAWKVNRHAGTAIAITPWQRRHPILAAIILVPRLLGQGAVR
ncbi:MAG: hypothetical protein ACKOUM_12075 [Sphingopyxis sp.]